MSRRLQANFFCEQKKQGLDKFYFSRKRQPLAIVFFAVAKTADKQKKWQGAKPLVPLPFFSFCLFNAVKSFRR
jgi:hypothetical protein